MVAKLVDAFIVLVLCLRLVSTTDSWILCELYQVFGMQSNGCNGYAVTPLNNGWIDKQ